MQNKSGIIFFALLILSVLIVGCGKSNPISTGFKTSDGYSINLGTTAKTVPFGGSLSFLASIRDGNGNPVTNSLYPVTFTSEMGGQFAPVQANIASGVAHTIYVAPKYVPISSNLRAQATEIPKIDTLPDATNVSSDLPIVDTVTVSYLGAASKLSIVLFKP